MHRFNNILVLFPTAGSIEAVLSCATNIAKRNGAKLTVIDVVPPPPRWKTGVMTAFEIEEAVSDYRRDQISSVLKEYCIGLEVDVQLRFGTPFLEVTRQVLRQGHDLLITAAESRGGIDEAVFGSTTLHLMRKCPCDILALTAENVPQFRTIVAALDPVCFPEETTKRNLCERILQTAAHLEDGSELHVVNAWDAYGESMLRARGRVPDAQIQDYVRATRERHERAMDELMQRCGPLQSKHDVHVVRDSAAHAIETIAENVKADLIVLGTVSRTGVAGLLIGNTAETVLQRIKSSVLAVKPQEFVSPVCLTD